MLAELLAFGVLQGGGAGSPFVSVTLSPGSGFSNHEIPWHGMADVSLDARQPDAALGGSIFLEGGDGRTILIRFSDLNRYIRPGMKVDSAELQLFVSKGSNITFDGASKVSEFWHEGPAQVVTFGRVPTATTASPAATHRERRAGSNSISWQSPGAAGPADSTPLAGVKAQLVDDRYVSFTGLESVIQEAVDSPFATGGIALRFSGSIVEFFSSQSPILRPILNLKASPKDPVVPGADLAVTGIQITPTLARPAPLFSTDKQDGKEIKRYDTKAMQPSRQSGELIASATVKNVGISAAEPFEAQWIVDERAGSRFAVSQRLAPGETLKLETKFQAQKAGQDGRFGQVALRILPRDASNLAVNDGETGYANGIGVRLAISPEADKKRKNVKARVFEFPLEAALAVRRLNESIFPASRYSSSPEGVVARVFLEGAEVTETPSSDAIEIKVDDMQTPFNDQIVKQVAERLLMLSKSPADREPYLYGENGAPVRVIEDAQPPFIGSGETRFDGMLPAGIGIPNEPIGNSILDAIQLPGNRLLGMSQVAWLNRYALNSAERNNLPVPPLIMVRAFDYTGRPLPTGQFTLRQWTGEAWSDPIGQLAYQSGQAALLSNRPLGKDPFGLTPNPFGRIDPHGANGALSFEVNLGGSSAFAFLKLHQLTDAQARNPNQVAIFDLRFNVLREPLDSVNLAENKLVTDSIGSPPAQLMSMLNVENTDAIPLGHKAGDWFEIDLGRDRVFEEIQLIADESFWKDFDIKVYGTGQTLTDAMAWAQERDFSWSVRNRSLVDPASKVRYVPYRSVPFRMRYIRVISRTEGGPGKSKHKVRVFGVKATG